MEAECFKNQDGLADSNSTVSQTLWEKSPNIKWGKHIEMLLRLWRMGQQMRTEGHWAEQHGGPSAPQHRHRGPALLCIHHPLFPVSLAVISEDPKWVSLFCQKTFFGVGGASCQIKPGSTLLVGNDRIWSLGLISFQVILLLSYGARWKMLSS